MLKLIRFYEKQLILYNLRQNKKKGIWYMRALLLAEKPSLMREIQTVYNKGNFPDSIDFMAFAGHTMGLSEPGEYNASWGEKKWKWDDLPMIPTIWKTRVSSDKTTLYNNIRNKIMSGHYDYIINACDPDREGQAIFQYVYDYIELTEKVKLPSIKRFWTNDLTETAITNALNNLRYSGDGKLPNLDTLTKASMLRGRFDWLVGMNVTRAASLQMHSTVHTGRVKTPTLAIVVQRELEIQNFKPETTYELEATYDSNNIKFPGTLVDENGNVRFKQPGDADEIKSKLGNKATVEKVEKVAAKTMPPILYKLSGLQIDASKMLGFGADKTLDLVQSLYEKKIVSYPRTDNTCISSALAKEFPKLLASVSTIPELTGYATTAINDTAKQQKVAKDKKYVDDAKLAQSGHYAIVPTVMKPNLNSLTSDELEVLKLIYKRFLSIFMDPLEEEKTTVMTDNNGYKFKSNGKVLVAKGYTVLYNTNFSDTQLPPLKKGDIVDVVSFDMRAKTTTPPQRYSDGTLINVMDNPVKFLTDDSLKSIMKEKHGIGTEATRAGIIKELVNNGYISKQGKGKVEYIYATSKGISVIENLKDIDITSVDLTGIWEEKLSDVEQGKLDEQTFTKEMQDYVIKTINDIRNRNMNTIYSSNLPIVGKCPKCGKDVLEGQKSYFCSGYSKENPANSCDFIINKQLLGAKIPITEIKKMLAGKPSKEFNFTKANGDKFKSPLSISNTGSLVFGKNNNSNQKGEKAMSELRNVCPECGSKVVEREKGFFCDNKDCNFAIWKESNGATYTAEDAETLIAGGEVEKFNTWRSGKTSTNRMHLENGKVTAIFESRPAATANMLNVKCPKCGGDIVERDKGFFCTTEGCDVAIWKNSFTGAVYTAEDAETLLSGGTVKKTNTWKSGKTSDNDMFYDKDSNRVSAKFD